ncbi:MAG: GNAT family N-acetyltransferase [Pseudomonadota bacterium]
MRQFPRLDTERLTLRAPESRDLPAYTAFYTDSEAARWKGGVLRRDQVWRRLAEDIGHWHLKQFGIWMLVRRDDGQVVGGTGLSHPEGWPRHEMTWWLLPHSRGTGLALEASRAILSFAINSLGWPSVETHIQDGNLPAHRLAKRLGGVVIARERFPDAIERDVYRLAPTSALPIGRDTASDTSEQGEPA